MFSVKPSVQILVDHVSREAVIAGLVSRLLEREVAITCDHQDLYLSDRGYDYFSRSADPVSILITPSYNVRRTPHLLARAVRQRARLVVMHSEQLFPAFANREKFNLNNLESYRRHVFAHLVWGEYFATRLVRVAGIAPESIFIVGNPKLDLAARFDRNAPVRNSRRSILFVSNFPLADFDDTRARAYYREHRFDIRLPLHEMLLQMRQRCLRWISEAAAVFPDLHFVLRPHPGESRTPYEALRHPNVSISTGGEIASDIHSSDLIFQYTSTSLFESLALRKPTFSLDVGRIPDEYAQPPTNVFPWISRSDMFSILENLRAGTTPPAAGEDALARLNPVMHGGSSGALVRLAIVVRRLAFEAASRPVAPARRDVIAARCYEVVPALKHGIVRAGAGIRALTGSDNFITRFARRRWDARVREQQLVTPETWAGTLALARSLSDASEIDALDPHNHRMTLGPYGWTVDLLNRHTT